MRFLQRRIRDRKKKKMTAAVSLMLMAILTTDLTTVCMPAKVLAAEESDLSGGEKAGEEAVKEEEKATDGTETINDVPVSEETKAKEDDLTPTADDEGEKALNSNSDTNEENREAESGDSKTDVNVSEDNEKEVSQGKDDPLPASMEEQTETPGAQTVNEKVGEGEKEAGVSDTESDADIPTHKEVSDKIEVAVPIYNYHITNVVAPAKYAVALNPYQMEIRINDTEVSTDQIVSKKYGIINKSSTDQIVTVTLTVEDLNEDQIVFVDSEEAVQSADEDTYAVYLAAVPADESGIQIGGESADLDTSSYDLSDVDMTGTKDHAIALKEGDNQLSFKLSKAVYRYADEGGLDLEAASSDQENSLTLSELAPGDGGIAAFTFAGSMNPKADWGKLMSGIRISVVYTYETAAGDEKTIEGTCGMIEAE